MFDPGRLAARTLTAALILPLTWLSSSGCAGLLGPQVKATATEQRSFEVSAAPVVIVETFNGPIKATVGTEGKVEASIKRIGSGTTMEAAEADLKNVHVEFTQDGATVRIVATRSGSPAFSSSAAEVEIKVPAQATLSLTTSNGELHSEGIQGPITARSSNGEIEVRGARGKLDLHTSNGAIDIAATEAAVSAQTRNGEVRFAGSLAQGKHGLTTNNGGITVRLPVNAAFRVEARTSNGTVTSGFPELRGESGKAARNHLAGHVGNASSPEVELKLETSNGNVAVEPAAETPRS